ncbi:MAG: hypothetical protein LJE96_09800 [Deltaproteobacteria bacterium]|nr:hypothetical protein [Deltaproteobacteria bacterium]
MKTIDLKVPFMALSTKVNGLGEMEKRFLTPFGTVDITFRNVTDMKRGKPHIEIEVGGDAEYWAFCDASVNAFRETLVNFVCAIINKDCGEMIPSVDSCQLSLHFKGFESDAVGVCGDSVGLCEGLSRVV